MSKLDFAKRLEKLVDKDCNISQREAVLVKTTSKYHSSRIKLQTQIVEQLEELKLCQKEVKKLRNDNAKLLKFLQENDMQLHEEKQRLQKWRTDYAEYVQHHVQDRCHTLKELNKLRFLKETTETFINIDKLPELIQGAFKRENNQLVPFMIDPLQFSGTQDVMDTLWLKSRQSRIHNNLWLSLISGYNLDTNLPQNISHNEK